MEKTISAAEANRKFSEVLRGVRRGQSYLVTNHGKPVARIAPCEESPAVAARAYEVLTARLRSQRPMKIGRWKREELYD